MNYLPELMLFKDGTPVTDAAAWEKRRSELVDMLAHEEYGYLPPVYGKTVGCVTDRKEKCCSGHAVLERVDVTVPVSNGTFTFPINLFTPTRCEKAPVFVLINFRPDAYDMYYPVEEIIDHGFAIAVLYYNDVTQDNGDMTSKLCGLLERPADGTGFGKLSLWAWAASRVLDYLETRPEIDTAHAAVIGHSRLGKTALWCGANDPRFKYIISNCSGCSGAAYEREKHPESETIAAITKTFPFWFCENFLKYVGHENSRPFDQHWLIAASAPRYVLVHSASKDLWADPIGEQSSCLAATPAWTLHGMPGFIGPETQAAIDESFTDGSVGYMRRDGIHFLGRADWLDAMSFIRKHW